MKKLDAKYEQEHQQKAMDYLCGLPDEEECFNDPKCQNSLFKRYMKPPEYLSIYSTKWSQENQMMAPPRPWEWEESRERKGIVLESQHILKLLGFISLYCTISILAYITPC